MKEGIYKSEIALTKTHAGTLRIGGSRVSLDSVIIAFNQGATPEQIIQDYDSLKLSEIYAAISYYLQNQKEVDSYLFERKEQNEKLRLKHNQLGIRDRLLARSKYLS